MIFNDNRVDYADEEEGEDEEGMELLKNMRPQHFFNNPLSAFLASLGSIFFWFIYCLAKALIVVAGIFIIISFIFPHKCIGFLNRLMEQLNREDKFRDEL